MASNRVIHFLNRLPVIKSVITQNIYSKHWVKMIFVILGIFFVISKRMSLHLGYMAILAFMGIILSQSATHGGFFQFLDADSLFSGINQISIFENALMVWFIFNFIWAPLLSITVSAANHSNDKAMINYFRVDLATYAKSRILIDLIGGIILYIPFLMLTSWVLIARISVWWIFATLVILTSCRLLGEAINLWTFKKMGKHAGNMSMSGIGIIVSILFYISSFAIPYSLGTLNFVEFFTNFFVITLSALFGLLALIYIKNYPLYSKLLRDKIQFNDGLFSSSKNIHVNNAKKWSKGIDMSSFEIDKHIHKTGFSYLNAVFFDRHSKFFAKKMIKRYVVIIVPLVAVALLTAYSLISTGELPSELFQSYGGYSSLPDLRELFNLAPLFLFIMQMMSMGNVITLSAFLNCDVHMLQYPYYRTKESILASFKTRLAVILRYNLIIATLIFMSIIVMVTLIYGYMEIVYAIVFFFALFCTAIFFAFNDLFLYYIIQPYDSGGKNKSVLCNIINMFISVMAQMSFLVFGWELFSFTIIIAIVVLLYFGIGMALLLIFSPKNFKLR